MGIYINNEITQRGLQLWAVASTWATTGCLDWPRSGCPERPESLEKPSRVTFLAQSRSTEAPRSPRESILVAPGGAPTLENRAPV